MTLGAVACGGDDGGDTGAFCADLEANLTAIVSPKIDSGADADAQVELYRDLAAEAPLALEEDWGALVNALETANEVVPGDPESEQRAAAAAYASERSAFVVKDWVQANCGVDMGPAVTVGNVPPPTTTTTVPGTTTTSTTLG